LAKAKFSFFNLIPRRNEPTHQHDVSNAFDRYLCTISQPLQETSTRFERTLTPLFKAAFKQKLAPDRGNAGVAKPSDSNCIYRPVKLSQCIKHMIQRYVSLGRKQYPDARVLCD